MSSKIALAYDGDGRISTITSGQNTQRTFGYDAIGNLTTDTTVNAARATLYGATYAYDPAGNLTQSTTAPATAAGAGTTSYTYDTDNRLASWTTPVGATSTVSWDANNNATQIGSTSQTFDAHNRLISSGTTQYDYSQGGDLASTTTDGATTTYQYDPFHEMTSSGTETFTYDALGRVATDGQQTMSYAGASSEPASDGSNTYTRTSTGTLLLENGVQTIQNTHGDLVAALTGATLSGTATYNPFGTVTASTGTLPGQVGYQGDLTSQGGLVHMQSRWYNPTTGAFTSRDTGALPWNQQNRYGYALGNPTTNTDPTGHTTIDGTIGFGLGGLSLGIDGAAIGAAAVAAAPVVIGAAVVGGVVACIAYCPSYSSSSASTSAPAFNLHLGLSSGNSIGSISTDVGAISIPLFSIAPIHVGTIDVSGIEDDARQIGAALAAFTAGMAGFNATMAAFAQSSAKLDAILHAPGSVFDKDWYKHPTASTIRTGVAPVGIAVQGGCATAGTNLTTACDPSGIPAWKSGTPTLTNTPGIALNNADTTPGASATSAGRATNPNAGCPPGQVLNQAGGCETLPEMLQRVVTQKARDLANNHEAIDASRTQAEIDAAAKRPFVARFNVGKSVEDAVRDNPDIDDNFTHVPGNKPMDFIGKADGKGYDVTTDTPSTLAKHAARAELSDDGINTERIATYAMKDFFDFIYKAARFGK